MLNIAPLDYERYAALIGPVTAPVEGHVGVKPTHRSTKEVEPTSAEVNHRQAYSMQGQVEIFNFAPSENRKMVREPVIVVDQTLTDLSWLTEYASSFKDITLGANFLSPRKVTSLYGTPSRYSAQIVRLQA